MRRRGEEQRESKLGRETEADAKMREKAYHDAIAVSKEIKRV